MRPNPDWAVPDFDLFEFRGRGSRHAVLLCVLNEGERIRAQLRRMAGLLEEFDTVIVDGGSTDGALDSRYIRGVGLRALLIKTGPGRLGAQLRVGLAYLLNEGYDGVILMDGNNKDDPSAIPDFAAALDGGWDHVQGSRFIPGGHHENTPLARMLGVRLIHAPAISLACGFRYTDTTNGFRAYSRKFLVDPRVQPFREVFSGYGLHYYLAIRAAELGFRVKETPVSRVYPANVGAPTKIRGFRGNFRILRTLMRACLHGFHPREARPT